jgi:hypothetical protein
VPICNFRLIRSSPSWPASHATCLAAGRPAFVSALQTSLITETTLDLDDGLNMCLGEPSQFGC